MNAVEIFQKQNNKEHALFFTKIDDIKENYQTMAEDVAIIKSYLVGNGREGALKKLDRHEKYINTQSGAINALYIILIMILLPIALLVFKVFYGGL